MLKTSYQDFIKSSQLAGGNFSYLDDLYEDYLYDPNSVTPEWRDYFASLPTTGQPDVSIAAVRDYFATLPYQQVKTVSSESVFEEKQAEVTNLINNYRMLGHRQARLDPLGLASIPMIQELQLQHNGLSQSDLNNSFDVSDFSTASRMSLNELVQQLQTTYCGTIGVEFMHITDAVQRNWLLTNFEATLGRPSYSKETKLRILERLMAAEGLERYLHNKYVGQKRFSLEGGDTLIPMLDHMVSLATAHQVEEIAIGMAHRGRLNVLVNILGQPPQVLFDQFEGRYQDDVSGDVKYHLGFSADIKTVNGPIHLSLAFNPSHLEIVSPVVEGGVRAKQDRHDEGAEHIIPVLIHGDASFAGQGVVMETFNLSQVAGYKTGGTIHVVINNQVGFTTDPCDDRSTVYCTDIAKMVDAPIFHVNGDDPEAALFVMQLAFEFRMKFKRDVVIDLVCYRRHGHNEADEPSATQPLSYKVIKSLATPWAKYTALLEKQQLITTAEADALMKAYHQRLATGNPMVEQLDHDERNYAEDWSSYVNQALDVTTDTRVAKNVLQKLGEKLIAIPANYALHSRIANVIKLRAEMVEGKTLLDWGFAETLAYATLLVEGHNIRISGQDAQRGTFFHRHAVLHNVETGEKFMPLRQLHEQQARIDVVNSTLSEEAVMGFDMGYAMSSPRDLVIWEAQFGDFANGAQVIVDQFLSAMEQKWRRYCGLVLLLPHGQEGQGPEHSSARLERYLQLCAQDNMQVCQPTTPAQVFHMLRRQVLRKARKPLIVMTPKSLLRHKLVVSSLDEIANGEFQLLIPEIDDLAPEKVTKVVLCSGKVYYDLLQKRRESQQNNVAIIRIEQLYPFPVAELTQQLQAYKNAKTVVWCQEEPKNQGAWYSTKHNLEAALTKQQAISYVGRAAMAAPACGYLSIFTKEQEQLINEALSS